MKFRDYTNGQGDQLEVVGQGGAKKYSRCVPQDTLPVSLFSFSQEKKRPGVKSRTCWVTGVFNCLFSLELLNRADMNEENFTLSDVASRARGLNRKRGRYERRVQGFQKRSSNYQLHDKVVRKVINVFSSSYFSQFNFRD